MNINGFALYAYLKSSLSKPNINFVIPHPGHSQPVIFLNMQGIPVPPSADPGIPVPGIDSDIALRKTPADAEHAVGTPAVPCHASAHSLGSA